MIPWGRVPALRLLIFYLPGLFFPLEGLEIAGLILSTLLIAVTLALKSYIPFLHGIVIASWCYFAASFSLFLRDPKTIPDHIIHAPEVFYGQGEILRAKFTRKRKISMLVDMDSRKIQNGEWIPASGKLLLYTVDTTVMPVSGQKISFRCSAKRIEDSTGYDRYLRDHGIYVRGFVKTGNASFSDAESLRSLAAKARDYFTRRMEDCGIQGEALSVAKALILGNDDDIPEEILQGYANTGAIHILSVSGLHVGLVFLFFQFIFLKLIPSEKLRWIRLILILLLLGAYALLTGLSPSVLRSTAMFMMFALGDTWKRKSEPLNTMAITCLLMLMVDPSWIRDIGFQLSYLAVFGILVIHPVLRLAYEGKTWILQKAWEMTSVSLASQCSTFPIILYYFGKFPVLFLLINFLVIPISTVLLYAGILLMFFSEVPWINSGLGWFLNTGIEWMNGIILFSASIPGASLDLKIGLGCMLVVYLLVIAIIGWLYSARRSWLLAIFCIALILETGILFFEEF